MNVDLSQYYNSLQTKDSERIVYFYDVIAVNKTSNIQNTICSIAQNPKKATGAERFKELVLKAESQKYDVLKVREYGADGQTIVNNLTFLLKKEGKNNRKKNSPVIIQPNNFETLEGFESALGRLGYVNGFDGVIAASAEKMNQAFVLNQQTAQISELKNKLALLEQEKEGLKRETETYKERYKEILDEKKDMERDHKYEIQNLTQKNSLGSLAVNGLLGFISSRPAVANMLAGIMGAAPASPSSQTPSHTQVSDDDDDDVVALPSDPEVRKYYDFITHFAAGLSLPELTQLATIVQFVQIPGNLEHLTNYCKVKYNEQKQQQ